jgi:hypothetical protein
MAITIEFLYKKGKPVRALDNEVLDEEKTNAIMKLKVHDTITLGSGNEKQSYQVLKIKRNFISAKHSGQDEDSMHLDYVVKAI